MSHNHEDDAGSQPEISAGNPGESTRQQAVQPVAETSAEQSPEKEAAPPTGGGTRKGKKKSGNQGGRSGALLSVLALILLAFGGGGYGTYYYLNGQMLERESALRDGLQRVDEGLGHLETSDRELSRQQDDLQRAITAVALDTEKQMAVLAERLSASESTGPGDWMLAEVAYLLRIANQRLITSRDSKTALAMLRDADSILKELAYPELADARRQLAADITSLQLMGQLDIEGIYFALESMFTEVAELNRFAPENLGQIKADVGEDRAELSLLWSGIVEVLSKYVRIDTSAGEPVYLVADGEDAVRRLAIQLQIRQAQLALLAGQQDIYSVSLKSAADSVRSDYEAIALADGLEELSRHNVDPEPMHVNASVRLLSDVMDMLSKTHTLNERGGQPR